MKRNKLWTIICITGLPWLAIFAAGGIYLQQWYMSNYARAPTQIESFDDVKMVLGYACLAWFWVLIKNLSFLGDEPIGLFTWLKKNKYEPPSTSSRKRRAQYPEIPKELLSTVPDGLVLGKKDKYFVRVPIKKGNTLNGIIMGSTGCGKSVLLLTMLLYQLNHKPKPKELFDPMSFFILDIKPELAKKSVVIKGNDKVRVMNPLNRSSYGWDVYYRLNSLEKHL